MGVDAVQLSKTVSHALRHEPWLYELELDDDGWVNVDALLAALRDESPAWRNLTERDLADMIQSSSKQRHELISGRIRALYGHSLPGRLHRTPAVLELIASFGVLRGRSPTWGILRHRMRRRHARHRCAEKLANGDLTGALDIASGASTFLPNGTRANVWVTVLRLLLIVRQVLPPVKAARC